MNRHVAALLSALWPGLGQAAVGARHAALILAIPPLVLVVLAIGALASPDRLARLALLLDPTVIAAVLLLEAALLGWRLAAVADAFRRGQGARTGRGAALTALALVFVIGPSAYAGYLTEVARQAALDVFATTEKPYEPTVRGSTEWDDFATATPGPTIAASSPTPEPLGRFTVLLIGMDSGPNRSTALTDTMIVASLDPVAGAVSMVSVPRDMVDVPLPDGRIWRQKLNSLVAYANHYPDRFPGATSGQAVLAATLGRLLGVQVDGWAQVNLPGFVRVVDAIGGIDVYVRDAFCDARYDEYGFNGFAIGTGRYHLDGEGALAYARIRKAAGESDFTRAARQQEVIVAARDRVVAGGFLADPAGFIASMGQLLRTSLTPDDLAQYVGVTAGIKRDHVFRKVIQWPYVHGTSGDPRGSVQLPDLDRIHQLGLEAYPVAGTLPTGLDTIPDDPGGATKTSLPKVTCYAPPPTAAPTFVPSLIPGASATPGPEPTSAATPAPTPGATPTDKPGGGGGPPTPGPSAPPSP